MHRLVDLCAAWVARCGMVHPRGDCLTARLMQRGASGNFAAIASMPGK
jgi:hypothetical protein